MLQEVGACSRGLDLWQGWSNVDMWQCMGHVVGVQKCGRGLGIWQGWGNVDMWQGVGASGMGWICESMSNVTKSKMLTMNEVHKKINLTQ